MSHPCLDPAFSRLLEQFGPERAPAPGAGAAVSLAEAQAHCRKLAKKHYENFPVLSVALPRKLRQDFANVYAYCRWADDLGDEIAETEESLRLLDWWQGELDACFAGRAWHPVFVALRETITKSGLEQQPFDDLLSAFRQDQTKTSYETFEELRDYCRRSADPVGRIVLRLCKSDTPRNIVDSDAVCTGLQLINFWQDIGRDFDRGRVYVPQEDRRRFGYGDEDWDERRYNEALIELMRFEVGRAERLLAQGPGLAARLPGRLKVVIALFALGGLRIVQRIVDIKYDLWRRRPTLTRGDVIRLLSQATRQSFSRPRSRKKP